jgi:enoyl-CoA hydratase
VAEVVRYELADGVATVTMDDGKVNALSLEMLSQLDAAFDRAEADGAIVVLAGRPGRFSGGFDLSVLNAGGPDATAMLHAGFTMSERMLSFPAPIVLAVTGHAIAMGLFLVCSGDYRVGPDGEFRLTANEVAIGLPLPRAAIEILRQRLTPAHLQRAANLAEVYAPSEAVAAGFLDIVVAPDAVVASAHEVAREYLALDLAAHTSTKRRLREGSLEALRAAIERDFPPA